MFRRLMYQKLRGSVTVRSAYVTLQTIRYQFPLNWLQGILSLTVFVHEYRAYLRLNSNPFFRLSVRKINPQLRDRTSLTPVEPVYFFQDSWAAGQIFHIAPSCHVDVGSHIPTVG